MAKKKRRAAAAGGRNKPRRLVCVVEGHGEVQAIPCLCSKLRDYFEAWSWVVDKEPIRHPRSQLVDERLPSPNRPARNDGIERALKLAMSRPADAVVVLCDADDDCPAVWGTSAGQLISARCPGGAVMVVREFEAWLLCSQIASKTLGRTPIDQIRDARGRLKGFIPEYKPTVHQLTLTRQLDIPTVWGLSDSFDKFARTLATVFGVKGIMRPLPLPLVPEEW
jgi:Domain of unknown function (DUF4276)